jgi:hypothetical protein
MLIKHFQDGDVVKGKMVVNLVQGFTNKAGTQMDGRKKVGSAGHILLVEKPS